MHYRLLVIIIIHLVCIMGRTTIAEASVPFEIAVQPTRIWMGATYNGEKISVQGEIPKDAEALIRIRGHLEDNRLKKKGRALGFLWMNLGTVSFHKVPSVFLLYPSKEIQTLLKGNESTVADLGLESVRKQADIESADDKDELFDEFVKLKTNSGLYGTIENAIRYKTETGDMKSFSATVTLPAALPQGPYTLEVFAIRNGVVAQRAEEQLNAAETGVPAFLSSLAFDHGTIYGVFAVLVAIIAGLFTGILFKGGKGAH